MSQDETKETFNDVINGETPVLIDFHADWCGPCQMMKPVLKQLRDKAGEKLRILKLDVDKNPAVASAFDVQGIPTFLLFKKGEIVWRQSGAMSLQQLEGFLNKFL
ncbi:MAG: trxA [Chitinophagaceae bacterium]|nr:trxA [Chitinophagaceae bacterium]